MAAKEAAKLILKKIRSIGKKAWDKAVINTMNSLPLSSSVKKSILQFIKYDSIIHVLDIVTGFNGTIENGLTTGYERLGAPYWLASMLARLVTTVLF